MLKRTKSTLIKITPQGERAERIAETIDKIDECFILIIVHEINDVMNTRR